MVIRFGRRMQKGHGLLVLVVERRRVGRGRSVNARLINDRVHFELMVVVASETCRWFFFSFLIMLFLLRCRFIGRVGGNGRKRCVVIVSRGLLSWLLLGRGSMLLCLLHMLRIVPTPRFRPALFQHHGSQETGILAHVAMRLALEVGPGRFPSRNVRQGRSWKAGMIIVLTGISRWLVVRRHSAIIVGLINIAFRSLVNLDLRIDLLGSIAARQQGLRGATTSRLSNFVHVVDGTRLRATIRKLAHALRIPHVSTITLLWCHFAGSSSI
mmetsp:Transcript_9980/g.20643  ORF Transcript_9980/g.20643 Transcript_9980/m.20643 type:complete len:269 (-) Transcript_9980:1894-2700(-)